ncbi:MAG: molybdopterin molybdotransferase MoeA [Candidatus Dadabacteria bacterium]|nr:molybdopterin molybdotransferase MoeA [Candidatus Dadabacteria bacterium]
MLFSRGFSIHSASSEAAVTPGRIQVAKLVSTDEAIELILNETSLARSLAVPLEESAGLVLCQEIKSSVNLPLFTNSAMDGYALKSVDTKGASMTGPVSLKIVATIKAGESPALRVRSGQAAKIMTGAAVPEGADSVVRIEDVTETDGQLSISSEVEKSANIRFEGEEIKKGESALPAGVLISPAVLGFLRELDIESVEVYMPPRVSVVVTGEELARLDEDIERGKIRDSNSVMLKAALSRDGVNILSAVTVPDNKTEIQGALGSAIESSDILITTGGVSVGDYDYVKEVFTSLGVRQVFWGISQRPGGPMFFGKKGETLVFGLPGNPASSLVCYYEYVRPAIRSMMGKKDIFLGEESAHLLNSVSKKAGKKHFLRGYVRTERGKRFVSTAGGQGSHMLKSFALSNCLIVLSEEDTDKPEHSLVRIHNLPGM